MQRQKPYERLGFRALHQTDAGQEFSCGTERYDAPRQQCAGSGRSTINKGKQGKRTDRPSLSARIAQQG